MTKVQIIIAGSGEVLNFDHVKSINLRCDNPKDTGNWTYGEEAKHEKVK